MQFTPLTPDRLVAELTEWVHGRQQGPGRPGTVIGFDGPAGAGELADRVAERLRSAGRPVIRSSTAWWWYPAAQRLEFGRQDIDMLLTGWVDADALRRELVEPVRSGGRNYISRLRDPESGRSVKEPGRPVPPGAILLLDGPFLLAAELPLDGRIGLRLCPAALGRALGAEKNWWTTGFRRYEQEYQPDPTADVLLAYDHPHAPAAAGLDRAGRFT